MLVARLFMQSDGAATNFAVEWGGIEDSYAARSVSSGRTGLTHLPPRTRLKYSSILSLGLLPMLG